MKPERMGDQLTLSEALKAATASDHNRLHDAPMFAALTAGQLPLESYVGQLRALTIIHGVLEPALDGCLDERIAAVWRRDMAKLPMLYQDLRYFEPRGVADLQASVAAALSTAEWLRLQSVECPLSLLGCLYVVEGSTLGAAVLRPLITRAFRLRGNEGLAYLNPYGDGAPVHWSPFQQRMNALTLSAAERGQICEAASGFFKQIETIFRALYPFAPESKTRLVTAINPEAGRHAVPADAREIQASLRAGDCCWERFPYFEARYGERGRRFSRSDAAWKATLCQFEPAQIRQQVQWLGRVLAGRGMPTFLLQDQLEFLVRELSAAVPEKKSAYENLLPAAAELAAMRRLHLSDAQLQRIADDFDAAAGPEWSARFPRTGKLLGGAVADELTGHALAVESLRSWMTDPDRFPAVWIAAVDAALIQARQLARLTANTPEAL